MNLTQKMTDTILLIGVNLGKAIAEKQRDGLVPVKTLDLLRLGLSVLQAGVDEVQAEYDNKDEEFKTQYGTEFMELFRQLVYAEVCIKKFLADEGHSVVPGDLLAFCERVAKLEDPRT